MRTGWRHCGLLLVLALAWGCGAKSPDPSASQQSQPPLAAQKRQEAVAALGQLEPEGEVRRLAAPNVGVAGAARIEALLVKEGQPIREGQVLARFDNRSGLMADLAGVEAQLRRLDDEIALQTTEVSRYARAAQSGAASLVQLETRQEDLVRMQGRREEALAKRQGLLVDLEKSELRAPLDGMVLEIHAREGERPGSDGVMDVGASQRMQARIEVYESDIGNVRLDQPVRLSSENGGFSDSLAGTVIQISPQVQQRAVLSTDPTGDADARVVEVLVALEPKDAERVSRLRGLKVIARFMP
ncbi:MAG: HlyD family efflux transporter periplasmic adaptor subunit [Synechococcus sp.]|nr:HlyD family efflux transporter periplasmic adaptor subunit [Synechococcus sp.]